LEFDPETEFPMSDHLTDIVCAHSPDSDDAFMFYGLATRKVRSEFIQLRHVLEDIETLNRKALQGAYELTAISYHAYPYVADKYVLMASGSSIGDNYGPMLVSLQKMDPREVKGKKIAIPGLMTTAYLALKLFEPDFEAVVIPFDKILDAVTEKTVDLGLIIHEGQLTYGKAGFHKIVDLGVWWKQQHDLPLPLGANALRRDLEPRVATEVCRLMRDSIAYALEHREQALEYAMQFARDMDHALADKFIGMYVNHYTVDAGEIIPRAAQKLLDLGFEAGLIKHRVALEFVR
jgi:1,4-dihydroxy-6-naphthoate synthase